MNWINKKSGPASLEVSCTDLSFKLNGKLNAVYFGDFSGDLFDAFINVAKQNEKYAFFQAAGNCAASNGAKSHSVMVTRNFDESPIYYNGESNTGDIQNWLD